MALIFWRIPYGVGKTDIIKAGIACKTDLVRLSLPARLRDLYIQFFTLSCNLFITPSQVFILYTLSISGTPKHLVGSVFHSNTRMLVKFLWIVGLVLKKKIINLEWFISTPKASPNSSRIRLYDLASLIMGMPWSKVSSINCGLVEVGIFLKGLRHDIFAAAVALFMLHMKPYIIIMNRKGDSGSPCLIPLMGQNGLGGDPLISSD
jgi:hypothetical protein